MTSDAAPSLIALDWGTSSLRAYLMDGAGNIVDQVSAPKGIMKMAGGGFAVAFDEVVGQWRQLGPNLPAIAAGMVGSRQGWIEAGYAACPAGIDELVSGLVRVDERPVFIVPGLASHTPTANVMRGEETQIVGVLDARGDLARAGRLVLPGTHSKWASIEDGRVTAFTTFMTGELFAVLRNHSILGRTGAGSSSEDGDDETFLRGVEAARRGDGVASLLFSVRALWLNGDLTPAQAPEYLSGLLIGDELRSALRAERAPDALVGDPSLCRRYCLALAQFGIAEVPVIDDAAPAGLFRIASAAGLLDDRGGRAN